MRTSQPLTIAAEIDGARRPALEAALATIRDRLKDNPVLVPSQLPDTHFTRWLIVDDPELPALLVWESNHDGSTAGYLAAVAAAAPDGLDALFGCCTEYPSGGARDRDGFVRWMRRRAIRAEAFYSAYRDVSRAQVINDRAVHDAIRDYLDEHRDALVGLAPVEIQQRIHAHVAARGLDVTPQPDHGLALFGRRVAAIAAVLPIALIALALLPVTGPAVYLAWQELRRREELEGGPKAAHPVRGADDLRAVEDKITQNQLTHLVDLKPGRLRLFTLRVVLLVIDLAARTYYVKGDLGGITSIHFARWVILRDPEGRRHRLIFFSNYDGSWDSYLGEFIDRASRGLTAIWSNTEGFPKTSGLMNQGARDEEAFKQWARDHQLATQVWWSGVPDATVENVRDDVWIRRRLERPLGDPELPGWMRRL